MATKSHAHGPMSDFDGLDDIKPNLKPSWMSDALVPVFHSSSSDVSSSDATDVLDFENNIGVPFSEHNFDAKFSVRRSPSLEDGAVPQVTRRDLETASPLPADSGSEVDVKPDKKGSDSKLQLDYEDLMHSWSTTPPPANQLQVDSAPVQPHPHPYAHPLAPYCYPYPPPVYPHHHMPPHMFAYNGMYMHQYLPHLQQIAHVRHAPVPAAPQHPPQPNAHSTSPSSGISPASATPAGAVSDSSSSDPPLSRAQRVERYKQKKLNRQFSKQIRYAVRKVNAERRPRVKGRFVKKGEMGALFDAEGTNDLPDSDEEFLSVFL